MPRPQYTIFYDGTCALCHRSKSWLQRRDPHHAFTFVDSRNPTEMSRYPQIPPSQTEGQMLILTPDGQQHGGYDGLLALLPALPTWRHAAPFLRLPLLRPPGRLLYRLLARNRHRLFGRAPNCDTNTCRL